MNPSKFNKDSNDNMETIEVDENGIISTVPIEPGNSDFLKLFNETKNNNDFKKEFKKEKFDKLKVDTKTNDNNF